MTTTSDEARSIDAAMTRPAAGWRRTHGMLDAMIVRATCLGLLAIVAASRIVAADPAPPPTSKPALQTQNAGGDAARQAAREHRALVRQLRGEREQRVRERGAIFARIAVQHDYRGEYVLFRDKNVTAFLDLKDPQHPRYRRGHDEDGEPADPSLRRAHILVVPNQPRETIGKTLASNITAEDLELTLSVMREAAVLATRFGIKNPKIYVRSPERVGVGYLHVHIVGERDAKTPYPPPLK